MQSHSERNRAGRAAHDGSHGASRNGAHSASYGSSHGSHGGSARDGSRSASRPSSRTDSSRKSSRHSAYGASDRSAATGGRRSSQSNSQRLARQGEGSRQDEFSGAYANGNFSTLGGRAAYAAARKKREAKRRRIIAGVIAGVIIVVAAVLLFTVGPFGKGEDNPEPTPVEPAEKTAARMLAVGDNLPENDMAADYPNLFKNVQAYVQAADCAIITEETICGGDSIGPQDYPSFNATDSLVPAVVDAGFDVIALAGNHAYDWGGDAAMHNVEQWAASGAEYVGMYRNAEDGKRVRTKSIAGINVAFLNFTYGVNGKNASDFQWWQISFLTEDTVRSDVEAAKKAGADAIVAIVHWGIEKQTTQSADQERFAQLFADLGVNVVIGSHPHVIQPMTWVTGANGTKTLVAYSLGNFTSDFQNKDDITQLGGMVSWDFVRNGSSIAVENVEWMPLVNHNEPGNYTVYALPDYTAALAAKQPYLNGLADPIGFCQQKFAEIVNALGDKFSMPGVNDPDTLAGAGSSGNSEDPDQIVDGA